VNFNGYSGRQKVLAIWNIGDTINAFYNCVDLTIAGGSGGTTTTPTTPTTTTPTTPTTTPTTPTTSTGTCIAASYTVRSGDTLSHIATAHGTTLSAIVAANPAITNPNVIYVGQRITITCSTTTTGTWRRRRSGYNVTESEWTFDTSVNGTDSTDTETAESATGEFALEAGTVEAIELASSITADGTSGDASTASTDTSTTTAPSGSKADLNAATLRSPSIVWMLACALAVVVAGGVASA
jgi:LysM repeat protein